MKIAPLEIRQKVFEKVLRGYNREEVHAFLLTLSREWEYMQNEVRELRSKLTTAEREIAKLREVEGSLYKTLKTAENTGANVIEQANKEADLRMKEAHMKADSILNEAQFKAKNIIESSENTSKQILDDMEYQLKELVQRYKTVEVTRKDLMSDLKHMADEMLEKVERMKNESAGFDVAQYLMEAKRQRREIMGANTDFPTGSPSTDSSRQQNKSAPAAEKQQSSKSFFDSI